jgi:N utilization substance protein B
MDEMFSLIVDNQHDILGIIQTYAPKFDLETMMKTNILAIAIAITEMLWLKEEIPAKVSINEAIDLSKYYGDENSKNIVN